jgi:AsmA protein
MIRLENQRYDAMKVGRILGLVVGGFVLLAALGLLSVGLFVDPNHYKPAIEAAVKDAIGRELLVRGDIMLSVLPWIALKVGPASISNPPGFGDEPFLSFQRASFRVRLMPLLARRLEIGRIEIDGLDARLLRNAAGRGNWEAVPRPEDRGAHAARIGGAGAAGTGPVFAGIAGIKITHARVSYGEYRIENLDVETGTFAAQALVPVMIKFDADRGVASEHARVDARFDVSGDVAARQYHVAALMLHGTVTPANDPRPILWDISTPALDFNLTAQTLAVPAFSLDLAGAQLSGSLQAIRIIDAPAVSGAVSLAPLVVREFLPRLGVTPPRTRDARALSLVSASFEYGYADHGATLDALRVTVDATHVTGSASIADLRRPAVKFALAVDALDLDRYLAPERAAPDAPGAATDPAAGGPDARATPLEADGTLTVGSVHVAPLDLSGLSVTVAATGGVIRLHPLVAAVDGGQYAGDIVLDRRNSPAVLTLDEQLTGVDVGRLVSTGGDALHVAGRGTVTLKAEGRGADADAMLKTLHGHLDVAVTHGAVEGVDVGFQLARAEALIRQQSAGTLQDTKRTPFDVLKMSADIVDGVARTQDLTMDSPVLKVTGRGGVNLPAKTIDLSLLADTLRKMGDTPVQIPLTVTGSTANPTVRPDLDALAKGQLRQKVQELLKDKLKGLFNR